MTRPSSQFTRLKHAPIYVMPDCVIKQHNHYTGPMHWRTTYHGLGHAENVDHQRRSAKSETSCMHACPQHGWSIWAQKSMANTTSTHHWLSVDKDVFFHYTTGYFHSNHIISGAYAMLDMDFRFRLFFCYTKAWMGSSKLRKVLEFRLPSLFLLY